MLNKVCFAGFINSVGYSQHRLIGQAVFNLENLETIQKPFPEHILKIPTRRRLFCASFKAGTAKSASLTKAIAGANKIIRYLE